MSEDLDRVSRTTEPPPLEIHLDRRSDGSQYSNRKSSTSTSSFEDLNTLKQLHRSPTFERKSRASTGSLESKNATEKEDREEIRITEPVKSGRASNKIAGFIMSSPKRTPTSKTTSAKSSNVKSARGHVHISSSNIKQFLEDRDPENVNDIVKIQFEEIFAEPEGAYSFGTIWGASYRLFTDSKEWCYKFLSAMCAVPCALCWGIHFACISFCQIWCYQPSIRSFSVQVKPFSRVYSLVIKSFIEPCFWACGKLFSSILVNNSKCG